MPTDLPAADTPVWLRVADGHVRARVLETYTPRTGGARVVVRLTSDGGIHRKGDIVAAPARHVQVRVPQHRRPSVVSRLAALVKGLR